MLLVGLNEATVGQPIVGQFTRLLAMSGWRVEGFAEFMCF